jgi:hypothetical protein
VIKQGTANFIAGLEEGNRIYALISDDYTGMEDFDFDAAKKFQAYMVGEEAVGEFPLIPFQSIDYACTGDDDCPGNEVCSDGFCKPKTSALGTPEGAPTETERDKSRDSQQQEEQDF